MAESVRRKPLGKEISIGEMLRLRNEQGMTNHDIAKMLEVSYATVYRYIGKQPSGLESLAAFQDSAVETLAENMVAQRERAVRPSLQLTSETLSCLGLTADIDYTLGSLCVYADQHSCLMLEITAVPNLLTFLLELSGHVQRKRGEPYVVAENE